MKYKIISFLLVMSVPALVFSASLVPCNGADCNFVKFIELIKEVIGFMMFKLALPLAAASFAIAGIMLMTAGGKEDQITKAKEIFWYVFVGIAITLSAWLVVDTIAKTLLKSEFSGLG